MKPLVTFPDPETALIGYLSGIMALPPSSTSFPAAALVEPRLQVELEVGNAADYPITERAQVRVTCHAPAGKRTDVKALASLAQAYVYGHPGDSDVAGCSILVGRSDVITDPDTKNLMVWFLARVNLKATLLAS